MKFLRDEREERIILGLIGLGELRSVYFQIFLELDHAHVTGTLLAGGSFRDIIVDIV